LDASEKILGKTEGYGVEEWRRDNPMDYFKAIELLGMTSDKDDAFRSLFNICKLHVPDRLFKYYGLSDNQELNDSKIETLAASRVYAASVKSLNDPFDCRAYFYRAEPLIEKFGFDPVGSIGDMTTMALITSFTACDENSMPMWAHYANNHAGYCVEYDMTDKENTSLRGLVFPVQYSNHRLDLTRFYEKQLETIIDKVQKNTASGVNKTIIDDLSLVYLPLLLCNVKHPSWSYEKEFRCSIGATAKGAPYVYAKPKTIFVGLRCADENKAKLEQVISDLGIGIRQMTFDSASSEYLLESSELDEI